MYASAAKVHLVSLWSWPLTFDLWPLKTLSAIPTHMENICAKFRWNPSTKHGDSRHAKNVLDLAMTSTSDLWPWKPFQQFSLARLFLSSFIEIAPLNTESVSCHARGIGVNGQPDRQPVNTMPLADYCWRRRLKTQTSLSLNNARKLFS